MTDTEISCSRSLVLFTMLALSGCTDEIVVPDGVQQDVDGTFMRSLCPDGPLPGARCRGHIVTDERGIPIRTATPAVFSTDKFGATDLATAYDVERDTAHHPVVAVLAMGDYADAETELAVYRTQYGLPACTSASGCFTKINKSGATSPLPDTSNAIGEMMLDLEMVSAGCPDCKLILAEADADWSGISSAVASAASLGARAISISYGWGEPTTTSGGAYLNIAGVSIFASSGDSGWGDPGGAPFPATSPYVTAVGGTRMRRDSTTTRGFSEVAWTSAPQPAWGTAFSYCSKVFSKPSWQPSTGCAMRASADVAAIASSVYVYFDGSWALASGTSVSAPLVAGIYAESHLAGADPGVSYRVASGFHDIVAGYPDNSSAYYNDDNVRASCGGKPICTVGAGWDGPTGVGTPDAKALDPLRVSLPINVESATKTFGTVSLTYASMQSTTVSLVASGFGGVPTTVTIPAGATSTSFLFSATSVATDEAVTITAMCANGSTCAGATAHALTIVVPHAPSCCIGGCTAPRVCNSSCQCVVPKP